MNSPLPQNVSIEHICCTDDRKSAQAFLRALHAARHTSDMAAHKHITLMAVWDLVRAAIRMNAVQVVEEVMADGFDVHHDNDEALILAAFHNNATIAHIFLQHGADATQTQSCALQWACTHQNTVLIDLLLPHSHFESAVDGLVQCGRHPDILALLRERLQHTAAQQQHMILRAELGQGIGGVGRGKKI